MLDNLFKLNDTPEKVDESKFKILMDNNSEISNIIYMPKNWNKRELAPRDKKFKNVSFSKKIIKNIELSNVEFEDCLFIDTSFINLRMKNCSFKNCNFFRAKVMGCYWDPKNVSFDKIYKEKNNRNAANIVTYFYQQLKMNAKLQEQSEHEMDADIEFQKWQIHEYTYKYHAKKINIFELLGKIFLPSIWGFISKFGYSVSRILLFTIVLFIIISIVNVFYLSNHLEGYSKSSKKIFDILADGLYYSFSILTLLGFSTITPLDAFAKIITIIEAFFGAICMALLTSTIVKRILK